MHVIRDENDCGYTIIKSKTILILYRFKDSFEDFCLVIMKNIMNPSNIVLPKHSKHPGLF